MPPPGCALRAFADAVAPGIVLAQAIGRWGNWFNQELYGTPLDAALGGRDRPRRTASTHPRPRDLPADLPVRVALGIGVAILLIWADRRFQLDHGRAFALYVAAYTVGRAWIECAAVDHAHHILGLRLNDWTCLIVFIGAVAYMYVTRDKVFDGPIQVDPTVAPAVPEAAASEEEPESETEPVEPAEAEAVEPDEEAEEPAEPAEPDEEAEELAEPAKAEAVEPDEEAEELAEPAKAEAVEPDEEAGSLREPAKAEAVEPDEELAEPAEAEAVEGKP